ncbi:hypothetical protein L596_018540 [Steinernema carpocapsae]|uniref:DNA ligase IV n=1 Tax=Steinernema carpocapsae TaxID=34508 RepID=A0A4V6A229_STECR|nr:hypothetical protein L596_018540 [Steinernema carpocapsae]
MGESLAQLAPFSDLCAMLMKLHEYSEKNRRQEKKHELCGYIQKWNADWRARHVDGSADAKRDSKKDSIYPALRLILPNQDSRTFTMKTPRLLTMITNSRLLGNDAAKESLSKGVYGIEQLARMVAMRQSTPKTSLTVAQLNAHLDHLISSKYDPNVFIELVRACTKEELIILFHIIIKDIEFYTGLYQETILNWFHPEAYGLRVRGYSLQEICEFFTGTQPGDRVDESDRDEILGKPFKPMLLKQVPYNTLAYDVIVKYCGKKFYSQVKYDGEHILVHKLNGGQYKYFTRNQIDYSGQMGDNENYQFSHRLHELFRPNVKSCVLDGELLVWDTKKEDFVKKGRKASDERYYDAKYLNEDVESKAPVRRCIAFFDVLYFNGENLMSQPLEKRLEILERDIFDEEKLKEGNYAIISEKTEINSSGDLRKVYKEALDRADEGIVLKGAESTYTVGSRAFKNGWFKIKPDYGPHATMDLAVVAVILDKDMGSVESFLCAVVVGQYYRYVSPVPAKMKKLELDQLMLKLKANGGLQKDMPEWLQRLGPGKDMGRTEMLFVQKRNIQIVEVRASGVYESNKLQFPAIVKHRTDKDATEAESLYSYLTFTERIREASLTAIGKVVEKGLVVDERFQCPVKRNYLPSINHGAEGNLAGKTVCIISAEGVDRKKIEDILFALGAEVVPHPTKDVSFLVTSEAGRETKRVQNQLKDRSYSIVNCEWLMRCESEGRFSFWRDDEVVLDSVRNPLKRHRPESSNGNVDQEAMQVSEDEDVPVSEEEEGQDETPPPSDSENDEDIYGTGASLESDYAQPPAIAPDLLDETPPPSDSENDEDIYGTEACLESGLAQPVMPPDHSQPASSKIYGTIDDF